MPITVRHDVPGGTLARLAALSGLTQQQNIEAAREQQAFLTIQGREQQDRQQAAVLAQQRDIQQERIQAAAQRQMQAADTAAAKTALAAGLEEQVKEDAFNRELETIRARAKASAEQWEYQYSAKARQDIARGNDSLQKIAQMEASGQIDSTTAARMKQPVYNMIAGIQANQVPVSPDALPEEMRPGYSSFDEQGNFRIRNKDGEDRIEQPWFETFEGKQKIHEQAMELKQLEIQNKELIARQKRIEEVRKFRYELGQEDETTGKSLGGVEIDRKTMERFGGQQVAEFRGQDSERTAEAPPAELSTEQLEQELQRRVSAIKQAKAFLKEMEKKYKNVQNIPPEILIEIMKADEMVRRSRGR